MVEKKEGFVRFDSLRFVADNETKKSEERKKNKKNTFFKTAFNFFHQLFSCSFLKPNVNRYKSRFSAFLCI